MINKISHHSAYWSMRGKDTLLSLRVQVWGLRLLVASI
ncbi:hypothetical protein SPWS13_1878 [Shewanella putrefaciens]|nr:hypothetical protein SPWS13_1878 [Shewanella putrefaciens]